MFTPFDVALGLCMQKHIKYEVTLMTQYKHFYNDFIIMKSLWIHFWITQIQKQLYYS